MKVFKYFISLIIFSSFSYGNPVETGHANVSLVKFNTNLSAQNELFIGIKMDMQKTGIPIGRILVIQGDQ